MKVMDIRIKVFNEGGSSNGTKIEVIEIFREDEVIEFINLTAHEKLILTDIASAIEEEKAEMKWQCQDEICKHEFTMGMFITPGDCPKCGCEHVEHY